MLDADPRRDIYETVYPGVFGISYLNGERPLRLSLADCDELVKRNIVFQDPDCAGWYHQMGYERPAPNKKASEKLKAELNQ